ncbi:putative vesicle transport v-snare protein [Diplogelasinospora grovesii]|uniref:Vesicle transport v-snare protein n=1 Tax=Diplogelasinospora grovesii TaxID=303347 RepID=A0AAN6MXP6_9PEZI|nr:putative vesicle transport v-snare protein [Diplogelasinospora grovesii]
MKAEPRSVSIPSSSVTASHTHTYIHNAMATRTATGSGWAQLRQNARMLETQTESLLQTYSQFSTVANIPAKPTEDEKQTEARLEELLQRREGVIAQLNRLLDSEATLTSSALKQNNLSLLRDKLGDHRKDLARLKGALQDARNRANLLGSVRDDISAYRAASGQEDPGAAEAEYMLEERGRLDRSHDVADSVLSQAYAVRDNFGLQRETLANVNRRITMAASQVPGINTLIGRISAKKRRDGIIMASFIAFCFVVFWFFL